MPYYIGGLKRDPNLENYPLRVSDLGLRVCGLGFRLGARPHNESPEESGRYTQVQLQCETFVIHDRHHEVHGETGAPYQNQVLL